MTWVVRLRRFGPAVRASQPFEAGIRYDPGLFVMMEFGMSLLSSATVLRLVDSMAVLLNQTYQLARARLASAASPIVRLLVQRDHAFTEVELLRRDMEVFRAQRESIPPHRRPDHRPEQRLAILQLRRLRGWSIKKTADLLVIGNLVSRGHLRDGGGGGGFYCWRN